MAKKIKPIIEELVDKEEVKSILAKKEQSSDGSDQPATCLMRFGGNKIDDITLHKLDEYESMSGQITALISERDMLTEKLAEYVEEIKKLKSETPKKHLDTIGQSELKILKDKVAELEAVVLNQLTKIAQLTYENAELKTKLSNADTVSSPTAPILPISQLPLNKTVEIRMRPINEFRYPSNNGYSSWN